MPRRLKHGTRKFACHTHGTPGEDLTVERGQQRRSIRGEQRTVVNVICPHGGAGGHEWWSTHPDAIARSRAQDRGAATEVE